MKSVLITGCSSGIGLCIAKGLKEKGYRVFASARSSDDVKNLQNLGFESLTTRFILLRVNKCCSNSNFMK